MDKACLLLRMHCSATATESKCSKWFLRGLYVTGTAVGTDGAYQAFGAKTGAIAAE